MNRFLIERENSSRRFLHRASDEHYRPYPTLTVVAILATTGLGVLGCSGCIGLEILHQDEVVIESPWVGSDRGLVHDRVHSLADWLDPDEPLTDSKELLDLWGPPNEVREVDRGEIWAYQFDYRWSGLRLHILGLPVPLMVPVGYERIEFTIREGKVASAFVASDQSASYAVGVLQQMCGVRVGTLIQGPSTWKDGYKSGWRRLGR